MLGCRASYYITHKNAENKALAGRSGAMEAIVEGMRRHVEVAGVQEQGEAVEWAKACREVGK